ncbi:hypothetical protein FNV43_RR23421 [Rhamnella rubrinervis]|uniref:Uncharacterized protein n=1 Tax=Rhamnella rubrinervis TaxID=2594499 RepID=A0A8K0GS22_9ROSA|nr:hypothetical protein FNV43_RR23421 [Rhamnella rubrinervis]
MAPSRRKGASKAAAAAAARRQWKVGDLVLAKVKGFPAWPATVSEPEKWGYSADWKKVLVYFFGTQQIAFCNPADVEAFTEEKKQSLLVKRHGKGADFVRAVQEIIESYEKLKKQDDCNSEEVAHANDRNAMDPSTNFESKDKIEVPTATLDSRLSSSNFTAVRNEPSLPVEDASATAQTDTIVDKEEPSDIAVVTETPVPTIYSRRRTRDLRPQSGVSLRKEPTVRKSRSSSRVESRRLQSFLVQYNDSGKPAGNISANGIHGGLLRRNKRNRKSPDASECDDFDSSAFIGSIEDNGSEIVTVDSDTISFNEGSTNDSGCRVECSETVVECLEGDVELNKGIDLQMKAVVIKKKRKPNRKRAPNEVAEPNSTVEKEASVGVGVQNTSGNSQNACVKIIGSCSKEDGDEHLPLVKRARVRMGKPSSAKEELNNLSNTEENAQKEVMVNPPEPTNTSLNCNIEFPADRDLFAVNRALDNASPSRSCSQSSGCRPHLWKGKKDQSFGCSVDGEAALPPSKRLHRALEAMSANAAEEGQACADALSTMEILSSNACSTSSISRFPHMTTESKTGVGLVLQDVDLTGNYSQQVDAPGLSSCLSPVMTEENIKSSSDIDCHNLRVESSTLENGEPSKDVFLDIQDHDNEINHSGRSDGNCNVTTTTQSQSPRHLSSNLDKREVDIGSNLGSTDEFLPKKGGCNTKNVESSNCIAEKLDKELNASDMCLDSISVADFNSSKVSPQEATNIFRLSAEATACEDTRSSEALLEDPVDVNMSEVVKEAIHKQGLKDSISVSLANDNSVDASGMRSSPCLTDGGDSLAQASPPSASICLMSTSDSSNIIQNNGSCSPDLRVHQKITSCTPVVDKEGKSESVVTQRPKSVSRNAEAHAALSSFEAMLGTLTRTKESIGRATRVAIDCAKFGVASKVVEILARTLESESSLHRRVDLFFLVDSIMQCSRGLKGGVGSLYPSAIQAALPRLLNAAAPPGHSTHENRRQCLKVLRLWLERRILPETIIRHHMRELDSHSGSCSAGAFSRRSSRTERSFDDPLREMEGMHVDEYGSNSSFQLPGFCMPCMLKEEDEGSDSDGGSFEAVTPEHNPENHEQHQNLPAIEKHRHILEDVDGELEMEDVAPSCEVELNSSHGVGTSATQLSHNQFEQHYPLPFAPPLPQDVPPSSPPLPSSPPPPPAVPPPCSIPNPYINGMDSKHYADACNMQDNMVQSVSLQSNAPRSNRTISDAVQYHDSESRETQSQIPESTSSSFSSFSVHSARNVPQSDGVNFHNKGYPLRPPHPPPSDQFSYVQGDQHFKPRREAAPPPSYSNRFHYAHNGDRENYYDNHERMKPAPYEHRDNWRKPAPYERDSWRFPPHSFSGPRYPDKGKSYAPGPFVGPPCEPSRLPDQGWRFPPRSMNHRNSMSFRPPFEGAIPAAGRGIYLIRGYAVLEGQLASGTARGVIMCRK